MIRTFEAFAGYGSQTVSLKRANKKPINAGISEVDKYAIVAYDAIHGTGEVDEQPFEYMQKYLMDRNIGFDFKKNKSTLKKNEIESLYRACIRTKNYGDISLINPTELSDIDLFTYSFPCQDISLAGNQKGITGETRSGLLWECLKIIKAKKPKFLFMENVKNLVGKKFKPDFDRWCEELEELGYNNAWQVINAKNDGIPQNRERVFMISTLKKTEFKFKPKQELKIFLKDILESEVDEKYFLKQELCDKFVLDINSKTISNAVSCEQILKVGNIYGNKNPERGRVYDTRGICSSIMSSDFKDPKKILVKVGKQVAQTLTTSCNQSSLLSNLRIRKLTPLECFRLMGMRDDDFYKIKKALDDTFHKGADRSNSQLYKLAGNSIVVDCMVKIWNWRD